MKNAARENHKKMKRDPLSGAPGHAASQPPNSPAVNEPASTVDTTEKASPMVETLITSLSAVFGEKSVEKWRELLKANSVDAQAKFYRIMRDQFPELPEDFSLASIVTLAASKPAKTVKSHPAATAATAAAGVGAFFLLREYLSGGSKTKAETRETAGKKNTKAKKSKSSKAGNAKKKSSVGKAKSSLRK